IAKSGTREMLERVRASDSPQAIEDLIGQFGVGFYSAFMVADKVTVVTRRAGEATATRWESSGEGEYTLADDRRFMRGTTVTLHLKPADSDDGLDDYTDPEVIESLVKRYSDFVAYPIRMKKTVRRPERDDDGKPIPGSEREVVEEVTLNSMKPIWTRPRSEVSEEEYEQFYRHIAHDWNAPMETLSLKAEGRIEYRALLFIPEKAPLDLFLRDRSWGLQLYVRRVLIMDRCEELMPSYLRFVRGVVDSADLPLNVSREMIQQDRHIRQMRLWLTRKVLDHLAEMKSERPDDYRKLWRQYGMVLKEGLASDAENRDRLLPLVLFSSSDEGGDATDLAGYVERMKEGQKAIYYLTGERRDLLEQSPHAEALAARDIEVLYLTDPIDEFVVEAVGEYEGHPLRSAAKGVLDLPGEEEPDDTAEEEAADLGPLLGLLRRALQDDVREVRESKRLIDSPSCLVGGEGDISPQLERLLRESRGEEAVPKQKRILEVNPRHPLVRRLAALAADASDGDLALEARLLYDYATLADGTEIPDPAGLRRRLAELMLRSLPG
ncbi:MAG: molecular chaperone HtpG, partial [Thermoanaerobaculia bacterium]|nr:molecular chaperone HtpG [Thermoanaerobaculia bacterium]